MIDNIFESFFVASLENEGGRLTGEKAKQIKDPGGATKWGISLRFLTKLGISEADFDNDGTIDEDDIVVMNRDQAKHLYHKYFWTPHYGQIKFRELAFRLWDFGINAGPVMAVIIYQRTLNAYLGYKALKVDGKFGPKSLTVTNNEIPTNNKKTLGELVYAAYTKNLESYYKELNKPQFIRGWLNRLKKPFSFIWSKIKNKPA